MKLSKLMIAATVALAAAAPATSAFAQELAVDEASASETPPPPATSAASEVERHLADGRRAYRELDFPGAVDAAQLYQQSCANQNDAQKHAHGAAACQVLLLLLYACRQGFDKGGHPG